MKYVENVTIMFAGDAGDGIQLSGAQFTNASTAKHNYVFTYPNFPAEIKAPPGTLEGVSSYRINFGIKELFTAGYQLDLLVAMNPAALKLYIEEMRDGSIIIINSDAFTDANFRKAGYVSNPLDDIALSGIDVHQVPMVSEVSRNLSGLNLTVKEVNRCKNFFALGIVYWLFERSMSITEHWIKAKFADKPAYVEGNRLALRLGFSFAEESKKIKKHVSLKSRAEPLGQYRKVSGTEALVYGIIASAFRSGKNVFYGSYPITPATNILHYLSKYKNFPVQTFQAEDEIAAICAAIGASYAGDIGVTGTSGPGMCLKAEALGLAVKVEMPIVVINVQRSGPSTGMPTKNEQGDLLQAMWGRHSEAPVMILSPLSPADCFDLIMHAVKYALYYRIPVIFLTEGYLVNSIQSWKLPQLNSLTPFEKPDYDQLGFKTGLFPLKILDTLPGTPNAQYRIGGLETLRDDPGKVSYDPANHQLMTRHRHEKIRAIATRIPNLELMGDPNAEILILGWGGTFGAIEIAVRELNKDSIAVAHAHFRYIFPFPKNTADIIRQFSLIIVPELNTGQLSNILRNVFLSKKIISLGKCTGYQYTTRDIYLFVKNILLEYQTHGTVKNNHECEF